MGGFFSGIANTAKDIGGGVLDFIPGVGDARAQERANEANISEAAKNRAFQERMSNTSYQRGMEDMRKAGLNPMLAFSQGGASAPSGSAATVQSASKTRLADTALQAAGVGVSMAQKQQQLEQQQGMNESTMSVNNATAAKTVAETQKTMVETQKAKKDLPAAELQGDLAKRGQSIVNKILKGMDNSSAKSQWSLDKLWKAAKQQATFKPVTNSKRAQGTFEKNYYQNRR